MQIIAVISNRPIENVGNVLKVILDTSSQKIDTTVMCVIAQGFYQI